YDPELDSGRRADILPAFFGPGAEIQPAATAARVLYPTACVQSRLFAIAFQRPRSPAHGSAGALFCGSDGAAAVHRADSRPALSGPVAGTALARNPVDRQHLYAAARHLVFVPRASRPCG